MPYQAAYEKCNTLALGNGNTPKALAMALVHRLPKGAKSINVSVGMSWYKRKIEGRPPKELSDKLTKPEFMQKYLTALSLFLKAKEGGGMRRFNPLPEEQKSYFDSKQMVGFAIQIAQKLQEEGNLNKNKHKRLAAGFSQAKDQYEALALLAKFYPLKGVCKVAVNKFIEYLERYNLQSVKDLMGLALIFYESNE